MTLRIAAFHPQALVLLTASIALSGAVRMIPALEPWAERWPWLIACGLLAFLASTSALAWPAAQPPSVRKVRTIRDAMARRLAREGHVDHVLANALDDAIRQLDEQILPALIHVVHRNNALSTTLRAYERGALPEPEAAVLQRLRAIDTRQRETIALAVQQAASADAALLALSHARDSDADFTRDTEEWVSRLIALHDALLQVLRGDDLEHE